MTGPQDAHRSASSEQVLELGGREGVRQRDRHAASLQDAEVADGEVDPRGIGEAEGDAVTPNDSAALQSSRQRVGALLPLRDGERVAGVDGAGERRGSI